MIRFVEQGVRGPIETSNIKFAESSPVNDVACKASEQLMIDFSSFYPNAYAGEIPTGDYRWLSSEEIHNLSLEDLPSDEGMLLSVDLSTPDTLMDQLDCLPLAPCKRVVTFHALSSKQQLHEDISSSYTRRIFKGESLLLDFYPRKQYVVYHKTLLYYLSRDMVLDKVHRGIKFKQSPVLKGYTKEMINLRHNLTLAGDTLGASIIKQMLCYLFGRMLMTDDKFTNMRTWTSDKDCIRQASLHTFSDVTILGKDCSLFHQNCWSVQYASPMLWGQVCLGVSKVYLYDGLRRFQDIFTGAKLVLSQTDSLLLHIPYPEMNFLEKM
jgi:hypothetical protein